MHFMLPGRYYYKKCRSTIEIYILSISEKQEAERPLLENEATIQ